MSVPAGWYHDHTGVLRYWNGVAWHGYPAAPVNPDAPVAQVRPHAEYREPAAAGEVVQGEIVDADVAQAEVVDADIVDAEVVDADDVPTYGELMPVQQQYIEPAHPEVVMIREAHPVYIQPRRGNGVAVAGFVVGLVSIFLPLLFGVAVSLTGLGLSVGGLVRAGRVHTGTGLAVAGLILSILGLLLIF